MRSLEYSGITLGMMGMVKKVVVLDLDRTLWDHPDISSTIPPFRRIDENTIADSRGEVIRLERCVRKLLLGLRANNVSLCVASWNRPEIALEALRTFGLLELFDQVVIEPHPYKEEMLARIARRLSLEGVRFEMYFFDDNPDIVRRVRSCLPWVRSFLVGVDIKSVCEIRKFLNVNT